MYKKKLIEKVLLRDLQPTDRNNKKPAAKPCNDKNGKERNTGGVAVQRRK